MKKIVFILCVIFGSLNAFAEIKEGTAMGFKDNIKVVLDMQGEKILSMEVEHRDPERVAGPAIQQLKQEILSKQSVDVDDIAGATATSQGLKQAVRNAIKN
ncbi:FMN-binding protein [Fusobacterium necrophorum]|uniref:FMN-binding protein n=1 Tax=Fusobacterium necrophorum DJ-2 TaxID=1441737 RepID=A0AB73C6A3_9FUSO|nr:FMN-binding protein [Fusobacterium necrophorum]KDE61268.1 FMN-binding protein [Fusobacterium necrophorum DJ-1]KDE73799.1 FMN-binding protein [Fusobacterium necrophorum DJ-2]MCF0161877.1 FMN-binding protein [Fusobacterium necrophorum]